MEDELSRGGSLRARAGDPPRTMGQKIIASHAVEEGATGDLVEVKVDQVVLAREPNRVLGTAVQAGLLQSKVEVSIAYPPHCIGISQADVDPLSPTTVPVDAIGLGFLIAQPGAGFAQAVHLERFASPARLVLSDCPSLSAVGAAGMYCPQASPTQLAETLISGRALLREPRSIQIQLAGRTRPFVCIRDVALELLRRGISEMVRKIDQEHNAPVVLEFYGPSVKFLSVADRAVLAAVAPRLGAAAALFPSDEKTEVFLRDQRRSKAYRSLNADSGATWDGLVNIDLAGVDPLLMDTEGRIRTVRELEGKKVSQVLLGGDSGISLRDLLATAALLKSKRVPPGVEFLLAPPSRQCLEVLARGDALVDLLATGARLIEPDRRILTDELYPARTDGVSLRTADPAHHLRASTSLICSAETIAYAVAHGELGDPRNFKRPVRITVPRNLPTDDVLLSRGKEARGGAKGKGRIDKKAAARDYQPSPSHFAAGSTPALWNGAIDVSVIAIQAETQRPSALVTQSQEDLNWFLRQTASHPELRAVIASHIPAATASFLASQGVLALRADTKSLNELKGQATLKIPARDTWSSKAIQLEVEQGEISVEWLAVGQERDWLHGKPS